MLKIIIILIALISLQSCWDDSKISPSLEKTNSGYNILHLTQKSQKLFSPIAKEEIEVVYYFAWGCPHCNKFNPQLLNWIENDTNFKRVTFAKTPVSLLPNWVDLSRLYYAAKELNFLEKIDVPIFKALHRKNKPLNEWIEDIAAFAIPFAKKVDKNITVDKLIDLMDSDKITNQILQDNQQILALMMHDTPTIVVRYKQNFYQLNNAVSDKSGGIITVLNNLINNLKE